MNPQSVSNLAEVLYLVTELELLPHISRFLGVLKKKNRRNNCCSFHLNSTIKYELGGILNTAQGDF